MSPKSDDAAKRWNRTPNGPILLDGFKLPRRAVGITPTVKS
jgi:hypothetical protein